MFNGTIHYFYGHVQQLCQFTRGYFPWSRHALQRASFLKLTYMKQTSVSVCLDLFCPTLTKVTENACRSFLISCAKCTKISHLLLFSINWMPGGLFVAPFSSPSPLRMGKKKKKKKDCSTEVDHCKLISINPVCLQTECVN